MLEQLEVKVMQNHFHAIACVRVLHSTVPVNMYMFYCKRAHVY